MHFGLLAILTNFVNKRRRILALLFVLVSLFFIYHHFDEKPVPIEYTHYQALLKNSHNVRSQCKVPQLNPWDASILSYYSKPNPLNCKPFMHNVTFLDSSGVLRVTDEFRGQVDCRYRYFQRKDGDDTELVYDEWEKMRDSRVQLTREFVEVECAKRGSLIGGIYTYQWAHLLPKRVNVAKKEILEESVEQPSVIMIGLDSMSRGNFLRQLPETYTLMQKQGFIDLNSSVKVLDNTYGNWLAIMTGKTGTSTREFPSELPDEWNIWFDDFDLIWKHYANQSYATLFAEDRPDIATFNYFGYLKGFRHSPVDHYFRPFWLSCYWSLAFRRSTNGCYDTTPLHRLQLKYLQGFLRSYKKKRKFAWWWTQDLSHDHLNQIGVIDKDLTAFLADNEEYLQDSIVIVFSDHGHRYATIRETLVGRLEARLPFLSIRLPQKLREKHPWIARNLEYNSKLMTTQYDLHETLIHVADDGFAKNKDVVVPTRSQRAFSLFRKVHGLRTCFEARVPEDYCPCFQEVEIPLAEARKPAEVLLLYANRLISDYNSVNSALESVDGGPRLAGRVDDGVFEALENQVQSFTLCTRVKEGLFKTRFKCAELELDEIQFASVKLPPQRLVQDPQVKNKVVSAGMELSYRVTLSCKAPSNAVIEGVVINKLDSGQWEPLGEIERNNKYGNSSACVADRLLKKLCHCLPV